MEVNIEKMRSDVESESKINALNAKEEHRLSKKIKKIPINHHNIPSTQPQKAKPTYSSDTVLNESGEYVPLEWVSCAENALFKFASLPAGQDAEEFEEMLRNSKDMNELLRGNILVDKVINSVNPKYLYGVSYASMLGQLKMKNMNKSRDVIKSIVKEPTELKKDLTNNIIDII